MVRLHRHRQSVLRGVGAGSILAVPALVYAAGQTPKHATTTSLVLVAITAVIGILPHWRAGRVRFVPGAIFGLAGIGGSLLGSRWNQAMNANVLRLAFAGLMLVAAVAMWRRIDTAPRSELRSAGAAANPAVAHPALHLDPSRVAKVAVVGTLVGLLTGFFGVGGGFVIVPALVLALGFTMPEAVGTSLLVITINSIVALTTRLQPGAIEWGTVLPFTVASLIGVVVGSRLASTATRSPCNAGSSGFSFWWGSTPRFALDWPCAEREPPRGPRPARVCIA